MRSLYLSVLSLLLLASCKKDPIITLQEPPVGTMTRSFIYPSTNSSETVHYQSEVDSVEIQSSITTQGALNISFDLPFSKGRDHVLFSVAADKLKPGYVENYSVQQSALSGLKGDAQVTYRYNKSLYSYVEFLPGNATGILQITSYDPVRKTIGGTYSFSINSLHDPKEGLNWVETRIEVSGSFEHVKIK